MTEEALAKQMACAHEWGPAQVAKTPDGRLVLVAFCANCGTSMIAAFGALHAVRVDDAPENLTFEVQR